MAEFTSRKLQALFGINFMAEGAESSTINFSYSEHSPDAFTYNNGAQPKCGSLKLSLGLTIDSVIPTRYLRGIWTSGILGDIMNPTI